MKYFHFFSRVVTFSLEVRFHCKKFRIHLECKVNLYFIQSLSVTETQYNDGVTKVHLCRQLRRYRSKKNFIREVKSCEHLIYVCQFLCLINDSFRKHIKCIMCEVFSIKLIWGIPSFGREIRQGFLSFNVLTHTRYDTSQQAAVNSFLHTNTVRYMLSFMIQKMIQHSWYNMIEK